MNNPLIYIDPSGNFWQETDDGYVQQVGPPEPEHTELETDLNELWNSTSNSSCDEGSFISKDILYNSDFKAYSLLTCTILEEMSTALKEANPDTPTAHEEGFLAKNNKIERVKSGGTKEMTMEHFPVKTKKGIDPDLDVHVHPLSTHTPNPNKPGYEYIAEKAGKGDIDHTRAANPMVFHYFVTPQGKIYRFDTEAIAQYLGTINGMQNYRYAN